MSFKKASEVKVVTDQHAPIKSLDQIREELKWKIDIASQGYFYQTTIRIPKTVQENERADFYRELHDAGYETYVDESGQDVFLEVKWEKPTI